MFKYLGFTEDEAKAQFALMDAFHLLQPHGGLFWVWTDCSYFRAVKKL
jgi:hypothetical protein